MIHRGALGPEVSYRPPQEPHLKSAFDEYPPQATHILPVPGWLSSQFPSQQCPSQAQLPVTLS